MSARFVIGRAGSGKSRRCFDEIVRLIKDAPLGSSIYWLLPKQATFTAERLLTCTSGAPAFSRVRVVSFQEFGREVLSECGGVAIPEITAVGRQMILGHLIRRHRDQLKYFKAVAHHSGLASELDSTFAEFERSGKSAKDLAVLEPQLGNAALASKLHDLVLLYTAYGEYLGNERLDPHRRLQKVLECVHQSRSLRGATVFVDAFYEFSEYERRFLSAVAKSAARVEITLTLDPGSAVLRDADSPSYELSIFHLTERSYRRLHAALMEENVEIDEPLILPNASRFKSPATAHLELSLLARCRKSESETRGIELLEAPDRRAEVDAAARQIQRLVAEGYRLRDIAVLVREMESYHELIDASFREHDLPWFVDRRRTATHHPLIQFTRALPLLALRDFDHDAIFTLLKSGLAPLADSDPVTRDLVDELENYVLRHRIRGRAWADPAPWKFHLRLLGSKEDDDDSAARSVADESMRMNALRKRLIDPLLPFVQSLSRAVDQPVPLRHLVLELLKLFDEFSISKTLSRWIEHDATLKRLEHQAEHARVWNELIELLDQMVDVLGDELINADDFVEILQTALAAFDLALTPPTVDQVLVGSVDRTRTPPQLAAVIVLGLNEGSFPYCPKENSIFCDAERRELVRQRIEIDPDTHRRLFDERFFAYLAFTRASEYVCVMRPLADDEGRPMAPSAFWNQLREIFPTVTPTTLPRDATRHAEHIGTPRQLVTSLLQWARSPKSSDSVWPALYDRFARHECRLDCPDAIDTMRYRAWRALSYENNARLSAEVAARLFPDPLSASVSRIETFANCPFKHFARYGLRLDPRDDQDVTAMDLGNAYHSILETLVRQIVERREDFASVSPQFAEQQIRAAAQHIGESLRNEVLLSSARNQYLLRHVERTVERIVAAQREVAKHGKFRPWKAELAFGFSDEASLPPLELKTPSGRSVMLRGRIDRVDLVEEEAAFAVIDYKLGGHSLKFESLYHGLALQLVTYLLVLQSPAAREKLGREGLTPAAAFYVKLLRRLESVSHPDEATPPDEPEFHLKDKPRGVFDRRFLNSLDRDLKVGRSQVVAAQIKKDGKLSSSSDALEPESFAAILKLVERRIVELSEQIFEGDIRVAPYRIGTATPCPNCDYRSVCRFDPNRQSYRRLNALSKQEVIDLAVGGKTRGG